MHALAYMRPHTQTNTHTHTLTHTHTHTNTVLFSAFLDYFDIWREQELANAIELKHLSYLW